MPILHLSARVPNGVDRAEAGPWGPRSQIGKLFLPGHTHFSQLVDKQMLNRLRLQHCEEKIGLILDKPYTVFWFFLRKHQSHRKDVLPDYSILYEHQRAALCRIIQSSTRLHWWKFWNSKLGEKWVQVNMLMCINWAKCLLYSQTTSASPSCCRSGSLGQWKGERSSFRSSVTAAWHIDALNQPGAFLHIYTNTPTSD